MIVSVIGLMLAHGQPLSTDLFQSVSIASIVVWGALHAFDRWVWSWRAVAWMVRVPDLRGTWTGTLASSWKDPATSTPIAPIPVVVVVRQSFSTISVRMFTRESESMTETATLLQESDGRHVLAAVYGNEPGLLLQHRSRAHHGAFRLRLAGADTFQRLAGSYWTDRLTHGEIDLSFTSRQRAESFDNARTLVSAQPAALPAISQSLHQEAPDPQRVQDPEARN